MCCPVSISVLTFRRKLVKYRSILHGELSEILEDCALFMSTLEENFHKISVYCYEAFFFFSLSLYSFLNNLLLLKSDAFCSREQHAMILKRLCYSVGGNQWQLSIKKFPCIYCAAEKKLFWGIGWLYLSLCVHIFKYMYVCVYIYTYIYICVSIYMYSRMSWKL